MDAVYLFLYNGAPEGQSNKEACNDGPVIGPVGLSWHKGTLKVHEVAEDGSWGHCIELPPTSTGCFEFLGIHYRNMEVWTEENQWLEEAKKHGKVVSYEELIQLEGAETKWIQLSADDLEVFCLRDEDGKPAPSTKEEAERMALSDREEHEEQIQRGERDADDTYEEDPIRPCIQLPGGALIMLDDGQFVNVEP